MSVRAEHDQFGFRAPGFFQNDSDGRPLDDLDVGDQAFGLVCQHFPAKCIQPLLERLLGAGVIPNPDLWEPACRR